MNKLMGFYELKAMSLPSVNWKQYSENEVLCSNQLWTIRSAVYQGADQSLPRLVGVTAKEAMDFANRLLNRFGENGIVVYYPFFLANKSGTLNIFKEKIIIEAVQSDLWNLVTFSQRNVTIQIIDGCEDIDGDEFFLTAEEKNQLLSQVPEIRKIFRDDLTEGKSVLLEWSFAQDCGVNKEPLGEEYLVFYEARTV